MATSPNFSWPEPDNTDLVKNGALAIRTAINAIDTSMVDLKGGTTGQVLSKASATDMDFSWVTDATGIPATIFDAKGDIIAATAADTAGRLAVGTNGQTLVADSSTATGLKWATASSGALTLINSGTFSSVSSVSLPTSSFTSTYRNYRVYIEFTSANANAAVTVRKRASGTDVTTANYGTGGVKCPESGALIQQQGANLTSWKTGIDVNIGTGYFFVIEASSPAIADQSYKGLTAVGNTNSGGGGTLLGWTFSTGTNYDSLTFIMASGTFNGIYRVYGYQD